MCCSSLFLFLHFSGAVAAAICMHENACLQSSETRISMPLLLSPERLPSLYPLLSCEPGTTPPMLLRYHPLSVLWLPPAGGTGWDEEDGDVTERILSCPPDSCMLFNCPGHQSHRKGLSGCGIDTLTAAVGTFYAVIFTVMDLSTPPATTTAKRYVEVVSPCESAKIYCPALAPPTTPTLEHACGTTDCTSREAILALQPPEAAPVPPSIEYSTAVPLTAVSSLQSQLSSVTATCGQIPVSEVCLTVYLFSESHHLCISR